MDQGLGDEMSDGRHEQSLCRCQIEPPSLPLLRYGIYKWNTHGRYHSATFTEQQSPLIVVFVRRPPPGASGRIFADGATEGRMGLPSCLLFAYSAACRRVVDQLVVYSPAIGRLFVGSSPRIRRPLVGADYLST